MKFGRVAELQTAEAAAEGVCVEPHRALRPMATGHEVFVVPVNICGTFSQSRRATCRAVGYRVQAVVEIGGQRVRRHGLALSRGPSGLLLAQIRPRLTEQP